MGSVGSVRGLRNRTSPPRTTAWKGAEMGRICFSFFFFFLFKRPQVGSEFCFFLRGLELGLSSVGFPCNYALADGRPCLGLFLFSPFWGGLERKPMETSTVLLGPRKTGKDSLLGSAVRHSCLFLKLRSRLLVSTPST